MNTRLLLALAFVIGSGFFMRDTITQGVSLMTGRIEALDNPTAMPQTAFPALEAETDDGLTIWERESNRRIHLWRDCTFTTYYEENTDDCEELYRLHEGLDR